MFHNRLEIESSFVRWQMVFFNSPLRPASRWQICSISIYSPRCHGCVINVRFMSLAISRILECEMFETIEKFKTNCVVGFIFSRCLSWDLFTIHFGLGARVSFCNFHTRIHPKSVFHNRRREKNFWLLPRPASHQRRDWEHNEAERSTNLWLIVDWLLPRIATFQHILQLIEVSCALFAEILISRFHIQRRSLRSGFYKWRLISHTSVFLRSF